MIASDVIVQTNRPWTPEVRAKVDAILADAPILAETESIETPTMVRAEQGTAVARMVELRAVEAAFPFYGTLALADGRTYSHDLLSGRGALVGPELLVTLRMRVGDRLMIGGQPFTIRGVIAQEPGRRIGAFSFGARVIVDLGDLRQTGLLGFGSRASYQRLLKVREDGVESADEAAARGAARQLRVGALLRVARGRHRRRPRPRRELPEPRRLRHRRAGRHRRVERDPRLRAPENQERRHPQVPGCDHRAGPRDLRRAGGAARSGRRPDRRASRRVGDAHDSRVAFRVLRRRDVRSDDVGGCPGRGRRAARLAALRARAAPRGETGQADAAPSRRRRRAASGDQAGAPWHSGADRPGSIGCRWERRFCDRRPCCDRLMAGGVGSCRSPRVGRVHRGRLGALRRRLAARPRGSPSRARALVSAAPRRPEPRPARQSDARHPAVGGVGLLLRARRQDASAEPHCRIGHRRAAGRRGPLSHRHPAGSGRAASVRCWTRARRARHRHGSSLRCGRGSRACAGATSTSKGYADVRGRGVARSRVHGDVPASPRSERGNHERPVLARTAGRDLGRRSRKSRSSKASTSALPSTSATRCGSTSRDAPSKPG